MRIAFLTTCGYPWGGCEQLWTSAASLALAEGHEVLISIFDWPEQHPDIRALEKSGAKLLFRRRFFPGPFRRLHKKFLNIFRRPGNRATYHDKILAFHPDRILFSLAGGDEIATDDADLMVFVRQLKIPFLVFFHSMTIGHVYPKKTIDNFREVFSRASHSLFTSAFQLDVYRSQTGDPIIRGLVLSHPLPEMVHTPLSDLEGPVRFALIGSLVTRWKGQDTVISVLSRLPWTARDWQLDIYGAGEDALDLQHQLETSVIRDRVTFRGQTQHIGQVYAGHHLVLIPSRQDTGPIVLFEAMLAGRPVVGTPMGAMPDNIEDGQTGILAEGTDEGAFAAALERAWQARNDWPAWGLAARARMLQHYDFHPEKTLLDLLS